MVNPNNYSGGSQDESSMEALLSGFEDSNTDFSAKFLTSEEEEAFGTALPSLRDSLPNCLGSCLGRGRVTGHRHNARHGDSRSKI